MKMFRNTLQYPAYFLCTFDVLGAAGLLEVAQRLVDVRQSLMFSFVFVFSLFLTNYVFGRYSITKFKSVIVQLWLALSTIIVSAGVAYPFMSGIDANRLKLIVFVMLLVVCWLMLTPLAKTGLFNRVQRPRFLFVEGSVSVGSRREEMLRRMTERGLQFHHLVCTFSLDDKNAISVIDSYLLEGKWTLVFSNDLLGSKKFTEYVLQKRITGFVVEDFASFYAEMTGKVPLELVDFNWLFAKRSGVYESPPTLRFLRCVDVMCALGFILLFSLPMAIVAAVLKLSGTGPVLFRQERLGIHKKEFTLIKFRSMDVNSEPSGPVWASSDDKRISGFGKLLRFSHLDELPQIFNLLKGDISLVGPRPIRKHFADILSKEQELYFLRFLVKPGLTGWAQVKGPYGANTEEQMIKLEMELYYLYTSNIVLYFYLIFATGKKFVSEK